MRDLMKWGALALVVTAAASPARAQDQVAAGPSYRRRRGRQTSRQQIGKRLRPGFGSVGDEQLDARLGPGGGEVSLVADDEEIGRVRTRRRLDGIHILDQTQTERRNVAGRGGLADQQRERKADTQNHSEGGAMNKMACTICRTAPD